MQIHNLGFPRIGAKRELKFSLEKYWRGELSQADFLTECQQRRQQNWQIQQEAGVEWLPVGDFAHYDNVLNTTLLLGLAPERFTSHTANEKPTHASNEEHNDLDLEFRIGRGQAPTGCQCAASDMTKWFNTNYHYIVPELSAELLAKDTVVNTDNLLAHFNEAQAITDNRKAVLLGPITYLYLSVTGNEDKLALLPKLLTRYQAVLTQLSAAGIQWLQLDEPVLGLELDNEWQQAFTQAYQTLNKGKLKVLLTSYFASIDHHINLIKGLNFDGLHIDTIAEHSDVVGIIERLPNDWVISLGVINGRNVWKTDLVSVYKKLAPLYKTLGDRLWIAPSCSLLHSPVDLEQESKLDSEFKSWLAFAKQKCQELSLLKNALVNKNSDGITIYSNPAVARSVSKRINNKEVQQRVSALIPTDFARKESFEVRKIAQQAELNLPLLPTTTIGSFPQTGDIRDTRAKWRRSEITDEQYTSLIQDEIRDTITRQEEIGLDVLVHGEAERNDMVEYFGELLDGVAFTQFAWVQSYGSRCVKPPIIFGDISRKKPMTVEWTNFAQSLTAKPVKAMLTGPITILCWSFVRDDLSRAQVAKQIALAISDEVVDLIASGTQIIQIDEPAIREGMPVKKSQWQTYLDWATASFCLSAAKAPAATQIHSHMCYSEFNDILPAIVALDADVLTIETSRSNMSLLDAFDEQAYPNDLGPGVYDIHTPNVPEVDWMVNLIGKAQKHIPVERLWVNPDCGLKTRGWTETKLALENMVNAAKQLRKEYQA
ncbi:5-methyltetrahydropteroyltriglutamate--homocysteine S-methyltransferase [Colwellia psychrerythraea]|uniref:5-methyltetrahydropteroyltriglutamate--homocysteine methyltransferase n=1 Tax=Colwellia psychrerythraea TaxID=28229 RepID=A0A099KM87_COLPS|nr:5-methyltetrahydropteroyltriglutamate--homocysteine S-methyltransferase [Colwellia psychrerythraea]KGJ90743.1 5-methyltetrahydropteroyltriglutamate--homocysteine methyltransferase [Colwellia psychrerythraea]